MNLRKTLKFFLYNIQRLGFITEMKSVYSAVRTGPLNIVVCAYCVRWVFCLLNPTGHVMHHQQFNIQEL